MLVVDHDDAVRQAIEDGLRAGGADVVACADGREGLALSRSGDFDLIVCDMQSPEVDGFSLLAAIEQDPADPAHPGARPERGAGPIAPRRRRPRWSPPRWPAASVAGRDDRRRRLGDASHRCSAAPVHRRIRPRRQTP